MPPKPPSPPANFAALRRYAHISHSVAHSRELHYPDISQDALLAQQAAHDAKLTEAITEVRRRIMDEEMSLSNMHSQQTIPDSSDPDVPEPPYKKLRKLKILKAAHDQGFQTVDYIPPADSSLNILLAYRSVGSVISQTNASIKTVEGQVKEAQALYKAEEVALKEEKRLTEALRTRLDALIEEDRQVDIGSDIVGKGDMIRKMGKKKKDLVRRTGKLLKEFLYFLDAGLARMVAAEEMGGPVVGDNPDVTLETGFDKAGRSKKGDRRIDEMWGQAEENPETKMAQEFKDLLEELMNASLENSPYVELKRDSAVARFLVRSKVACFHPKDARRLKLVDFGSNVEDG